MVTCNIIFVEILARATASGESVSNIKISYKLWLLWNISILIDNICEYVYSHGVEIFHYANSADVISDACGNTYKASTNGHV